MPFLKPEQEDPFSMRLLFLCMCVSLVQAVSAKVTLVEESVVTDEGLHFWYPNGEKAFHYAPSISPRGDCYTVANGYIFFGWYKGGMDKRDLMISRKKIGSDEWMTVQLPHKNTMIGPKARWGESHNTITVGVSTKDATIHIFYDHHNDPLKYIVSKKNTAFVPNKDFTNSIFEPTRGYLAEGEDVRITYPKLTENGLGDIILNYRKGSAIGGNEMVHVYNGDKWTRATMVMKGSDKSIPENKKNYAYGAAPTFAGGNMYYAFSVRWRHRKAAGVLNEGVYVAKCGPTMTDDWEDLRGGKHKLPIVDYSPFLISDPKSAGGKGSSGGPNLAVSEKGDVLVTFSSRGGGGEYDYTYTRAAGEVDFEETKGSAKIGDFWGDRMYALRRFGDRKLIVESKSPEDRDWKTELEVDTGIRFGGSVTRLLEGHLVFIAEDRTNPNTDKNKIHCYAFRLDGAPVAGSETKVLPKVTHLLTTKEGIQAEVELVDVRGGSLICILEGQRMEIPITEISAADVEFLRKWYEERE